MKLARSLVLGLGLLAAAGLGPVTAASHHDVAAAPATPVKPAPKLSPPPGHTVVTRAGLESLARSGRVWCQDWRASEQTCGGIAFLDPQADGSMRETVWFRLTDAPAVDVGLRDVSTFDGDALCSLNNSKTVDMAVMIDGAPADARSAAVYEFVVKRQLASDDGKRSCESFFQGASADSLVSAVTTDGARDAKLDSTYHLLPAGAQVRLRTAGDNQTIV